MTSVRLAEERSECSPLRVLSLGAGVQSSTMALMYMQHELEPMPDCAIFADTQQEPAAVYDWLRWLEQRLPFPIHQVTKGDLWASATRVRRTRDGERTYIATAIPAYTLEKIEPPLEEEHEDIDQEYPSPGFAYTEKKGKAQRHCTRDFKINPINAKVRQLLGRKRITKRDGVLAHMLIGISTDEHLRMKPNHYSWIESRWPLIDAGMSRADCLAWMERNGYPAPPRSACTFCPYRSDEQWLALTPAEFDDACLKETELQAAYRLATELDSVPYLHASRQSLRSVKLDPYTRRKMAAEQRNLFNNECEGMCGV